LAWAERQAALLRQFAAGATPTEAIDWTHVIEEIHDVGLSELRACSSFLTQVMVHLLKLRAWPQSQAAGLWRDEARRFLDDAQDRFTPSTRQRIALDILYARALRRVRDASDDSGPPSIIPDTCPFTLDDLLSGGVDRPSAATPPA
jgi:hypothetical protein